MDQTQAHTQPPATVAGEIASWQAFLEEQELRARELIRAHPVAALCGATALGFLLARLIHRDE